MDRGRDRGRAPAGGFRGGGCLGLGSGRGGFHHGGFHGHRGFFGPRVFVGPRFYEPGFYPYYGYQYPYPYYDYQVADKDMKRGHFASNRSAVTVGLPSPVALRRRDRSKRRRAAPGSCRLRLGDEELRQALEVQDPADQQRLLPDAPQTAPTEAPQPVPVLALTEEFLDQLPAPLGQLVAASARSHAHAGMRLGAAARVRRDVGLDAAHEQRLEEVLWEEPLVSAEPAGRERQPPSRPIQQGQAPRLLRRAALEDLHAQPQQQAVAVLPHRIDGVARVGAPPRGPLRHESAVGVRRGPMRPVAPPLPPEVDGPAAPLR